MELKTRLKRIAVIGAAGKMGRGISFLMTDLMANQQLDDPEKSGYRIHLVDVSEDALTGLSEYLRSQLRKAAEKNVNSLRKAYASRADLVENGEMIEEYVNGAMLLVRPSSAPEAARDAHIVFEAALENLEVKRQIYAALDKVCSGETLFFTNTSSIPISELEKVGGLKGRVMGVHFYNPPPVQKLVEMIESKSILPETKETAYAVGKMLRKTLVPSNDIAGFIGNGHFIRDGLHAIREAEDLRKKGMRGYETIYALNRVTQDFLVRPMGIFQLIDYVGLDVFQCILKVMSGYLNDKSLQSDLVDEFLKQGIKGGQFADGSQKDGFLKYEKNRPVGVYCLKERKYALFSDGNWGRAIDEKLGPLPQGHFPWKALLSDKKKEEKLTAYFAALKGCSTLGGTLATKYLVKAKEIALFLKDSGVTDDVENVNSVMTNGFFHLYGPVNRYI